METWAFLYGTIQVDQHIYLGVIVRSINKTKQDLFPKDYRFISAKSQKAIFSMKKKLNIVQTTPPSIMFDMFDTLIGPILTEGNDVRAPFY